MHHRKVLKEEPNLKFTMEKHNFNNELAQIVKHFLNYQRQVFLFYFIFCEG